MSAARLRRRSGSAAPAASNAAYRSSRARAVAASGTASPTQERATWTRHVRLPCPTSSVRQQAHSLRKKIALSLYRNCNTNTATAME